ncbi:MAG: hypothetical protein MUF87_07410 [Anaerolineae bacterium]|jgi:hypothetical protein|nr:hypothetical protein [Anaerolineae bacterium]
MSNYNLPHFQKRSQHYAQMFIERALSHRGEYLLKEVIVYDDGHFRAVFGSGYFGDQPPTKSQWSTFKKHLKRVNPRVFVFKEYGTQACDQDLCYYIDFGFFAD